MVKNGLLLHLLLFLEQWTTWMSMSQETTFQGEKGRTWKEWKGTGNDKQEEEEEQKVSADTMMLRSQSTGILENQSLS